MKTTGILIVDIQGDFTRLKHGSLAVEGTDADYLRIVTQTARNLKTHGFKLFATQDWHPADHISFFTNTPGKKPFETSVFKGRTQILWPPHCIQHTKNADLLIDPSLFTAIVQKGMHPEYDSYSGFRDDGGRPTGLDDILNAHDISHLVIFGLATDFCVKATVLDAVANGYDVTVIKSLCKGVAEESTRAAWDEMKQKGVRFIAGSDVNAVINAVKTDFPPDSA